MKNKILSVAVPLAVAIISLLAVLIVSYNSVDYVNAKEYERTLSYIQKIAPSVVEYETLSDECYAAAVSGATYYFVDATVYDDDGGEARVIVGADEDGDVIGVNIIYSYGMELMDAETYAISYASSLIEITNIGEDIIVVEPIDTGNETLGSESSDFIQSDSYDETVAAEANNDETKPSGDGEVSGEKIKISDPSAKETTETYETTIVISPDVETTLSETDEETTEEPIETTAEEPIETTAEVTTETTAAAPEETTTLPPETTEAPTETTAEEITEVTTEAPAETTTEAPAETTEAPTETTAETTGAAEETTGDGNADGGAE